MSRILTGPRFVHEAIVAGSVNELFVVRGKHDELMQTARTHGVKVHVRERRDLDRLAKGVKHQGVVARGPDYAYASLDALVVERARIVALDEIQDPHNVGAIVRSAVAFGASILVPEHRASHVTPVVVRASAGATEHAQIARVTNLQKALLDLGQRGLEIVGLDGHSDGSIADLGEPPIAGRVIVVGSEGKGLRRLVRKRCDRIVSIPMRGPVESLNASVAAALAIYESWRA